MLMRNALIVVGGLFGIALTLPSWSLINQVRVINETEKVIHIHPGGYSPSKKILPKKWLIFKFPFTVKVPNKDGAVQQTGLLVATAGGMWITTPNGYTYLKNPTLVQCIDYNTPNYQTKSGNRVWIINGLSVDQQCYRNKLKGYRQVWYTDP